MNRDLSEYKKWSAAEIQERSSTLADYAIKMASAFRLIDNPMLNETTPKYAASCCFYF